MPFAGTHWLGRAALLAVLLCCGCTTKTLVAVEEQEPKQGGNCEPVGGIAVERTWESAPLAVLSSELSPAIMIHTTRPSSRSSIHMSDWGLGAPTHVAMSTPQGIKTMDRPPGTSLDLPVSALAESWMLFWFRDSAGFTEGDSPWLVVWQHRPGQLTLDDVGLHAHADAPLGYVAMMPLYGHAKQDTSGWTALPNGALESSRTWAKAVREYPLAVDEPFRLDPKAATVTIHSQFTWLSTDDDWQTLHSRFAPLSPSLALALQSQRMPMTVSGPVTDPEIFTTFGPYVGVADTDCHEITLAILGYVTNTEKEPEPDITNPIVATALAIAASSGRSRLQATPMACSTRTSKRPTRQHLLCVDVRGLLRASAALPRARRRRRSQDRLHRYFSDVLQERRFKSFDGRFSLVGPGVVFDGQHYEPAGNYSSNLLVTLWTYAHSTGRLGFSSANGGLSSRGSSLRRA